MNRGLEIYTDIPTISNRVGGTCTIRFAYTAIRIIILHIGVADPKNLMPMYEKLHTAIREVDDRHIILFEPTIIITSVSIAHFYFHNM